MPLPANTPEKQMGQGIERLSAIEVKNAKPNPDGKARILADGGGLRLCIKPNGAKYWQFRSKSGGKETTLQLGTFPRMSLAEARIEANRLRRQKDDGLNPAIERKFEDAQRKAESNATFKSVAERLLEAKESNGISESYLNKIKQGLNANLYGDLGDLPIQRITSPLLKTSLMPIQKRGSTDMLRFILRIAGEVFDYAKTDGLFSGDNPAHALRKNVFAQHRSAHMEALDWSRMNAYMNKLDTCGGEFSTVCCLKLLILTGCRPGEARGAKWSEFDLENACWTIPAERMKARKTHKIPLARQTLAMLKELQQVTGHKEFLFPGQRGAKTETLSDMALLKCARRADSADSKITAHGFRAVFRTHAEESGLWPFEVMEAALAHGKQNSVVAAYARATHYDQRIKLAQWYAYELDKVKSGLKVLSSAKSKAA